MVIRATREQLDVREIPIALHPRVGDIEAVAVSRRLAPPARDPRLQPDVPLPRCPARCMFVLGSIITLLVFAGSAALRTEPVRALADLRLPAHPARRAGDRARTVGARVRRLLHQRAGPALPEAARDGSGWSTGWRSRCSSPSSGWPCSAIIIGSWAATASAALGEVRLAILASTVVCGRRADLLHVVPALDHRPAPATRRAVSDRALTIEQVGPVTDPARAACGQPEGGSRRPCAQRGGGPRSRLCGDQQGHGLARRRLVDHLRQRWEP